MDWLVIVSTFLVISILYMLANPVRTTKVRQKIPATGNDHSVTNGQVCSGTYSLVAITGVYLRRNNTVIALTSIQNQTNLDFIGIRKGDASETVYVLVAKDGVITQFSTVVQAQRAYVKGDYGIVAVTMSSGAIHQRSIVPDTIDSENSYNVEFSLAVASK